MAFSPSQQGVYRPLVDAAWKLHSRRSGTPEKDKPARADWYAAELQNAIGSRSTKTANKGRHFERACAHFEALAEAGITHQLRLINGDLRRIKNAVGNINPGYLKTLGTDAEIISYCQGIATQAKLPARDLHDCSDREIQIILRALCCDAHRSLKAA